jgi:four helix bundle protein
MDNIARGFDRDRNKEIIQFLSIATSSCKASKSQLYPCLDRKYVTTNHFENISTKIDPRKVQTAGFMKYLKYCDHKANKYDKNVKQPQRSNRQSNCDRN